MKKALELRKKIYEENKRERIADFYYQLELEKNQQPLINAIKNQSENSQKENQEDKYYLSISPGPIGAKYLARGNTIETKNYFFKLINNQVYLKDKPINFLGDNIVLNEEVIPMTENLYKLISRDKNIVYENLNLNEKEIYYYIANKLNFFNGGRGSGGYLSNDYKIYKSIKQSMEVKEPIVEEIEGSGLIKDFNYLINRLKLLLAGRQAGNKGVDNEISDIIKYLFETNKITKETFITITNKLFK